MAVYVASHYRDWPTTIAWSHYFQHSEVPTRGYRIAMSPVQNIYCIGSIYEGTARPAWYPAHTADRAAGASSTTGGTPVRRYYSFTGDADYIDYDVPSDGAGADTLIVYVLGVSGAGTLEVVKNRGASEVVVGTVDTNNATTVYDIARTVSLAVPLVAGDVISFRRNAAANASDLTCRVQGFYAYDSDGAATYNAPFAMPSETQIDSSGTTTIEGAYAVAPVGETPKWVGGEAHQAGDATNCKEIEVTNAYTLNGAAWTPATGWKNGTMRMVRTSTIDYSDAGHTELGTIVTSYSCEPKAMRISSYVTAGVDLAIGSLYPAMLSGATSFSFSMARSGGTWQVADITPTDDSQIDVEADRLTALNGVYYGGTPLGSLMRVKVTRMTHAPYASFWWCRAAGPKWYMRVLPASTVAGTIIGGEFELTATNRVNRYQQPRQMLMP